MREGPGDDSQVRIVVCIDVPTASVSQAYGEVYEVMNSTGLEWESSDEWFEPDGGLGDPDVLQQARMDHWARTIAESA